MKSIFRIYAKTSKGNDNHLLRELKCLNLDPKYDQHLNAFYFDSNFKCLFDISFHSMTIQQMYVQIGQNFRLLDEEQITYDLQKLPFKNYIPIQRGLVQSTTLKVLVRQSVHIPSDNVLISLMQNVLNREIVKKEYFKNIVNPKNFQPQNDGFFQQQNDKKLIISKNERKNIDSFFQIKDIVQNKWYHQDVILDQQHQKSLNRISQQIKALKNEQLQLANNKSPTQNNQLILRSAQQVEIEISKKQRQIKEIQSFNKQNYLNELLSYHPHLIFYIRKNRGRILLKINKEDLYKHGWKGAVNWGPIRQSIAASALHQSKILRTDSHFTKTIKLWDPMCGSGTIPLVASTILDNLPIRNKKDDLFLWKHWSIYKQKYLQDYWRESQLNKKQNNLKYQLVLSDKDRQAINYSIDNFRALQQKHESLISSNKIDSELFPSKSFNSQILEIQKNKIGFACGDFQQVMKLLLPNNKNPNQKYQNINIITNMPYLHGRSEQKYPLNQLKSIYKRFSDMISKHKQYIDNVFVVLDRNTSDWNHFVKISNEKWTCISQFTSGGLEIGLYAWSQNRINSKFQYQNSLITADTNLTINTSAQQRQVYLKKGKSIENALIQYRTKLSQIDRKYYNVPKHLMRNKDKHGYKRILQKRRVRHLQSAYQIFAKRRDKLIAFKKYANLKLQTNMIRRGAILKTRNLKLFNNSPQKIQQYSQQIKQMFQKKISQAVIRQQQNLKRKKLKQGNQIDILKQRNKWNNEKHMIKQVKKSTQRPRKKNDPIKMKGKRN